MNDIVDVIAIDGPAGAGKSSVAKQLARELGFAFLDTGAMYRAATWWAIDQGVNLDDPDAVVECTRRIPLDMYEGDDGMKVFVDDKDISEAIRTPEITCQIRKLDHNPKVREQLVALQQQLGAKGPTVAEGRDIGTVVFPAAKCKIYMDASIEIRAERRAKQLAEKGIDFDMEKLKQEIRERDESDMTREVSPLRKADDAILLDTGSMTYEEVVDHLVGLARKVF